MPYKLSATLEGHTTDVKAVASPTDELVLSASRDATAKSWVRQSSSESFVDSSTYSAGTRFINSVAYLAPSPEVRQAFIVTGGQDAIINIFAIGSDRTEPDYSLLGHRDNVCALATTPSGTIISGSWDSSARVWQKFKIAFDLLGHAQSVWAVLAVDDNTFLTGSADKTIKLWRAHKCTHTYTGHTQAVRDLALIQDIGFASCSNDSEIRVWTTEGDVVHILSGHTSFIYSLSVLPNGDLISGGEDRSVRVWRDGSCIQTIVHPAISVWSVSSMPNGDIVSGCSDGVVRVFSNVESRWTNSDKLKAYDDVIANQALPSQQVGDVKKSDLPGVEALLKPGKSEGQVIMIRNQNAVEAHQWDSSSSQWLKVGEVVDAVGSGRKQLYQGKEYDYVFDVDIQDGVPPLKLPYNVRENPYQAAQRFLEANDLPMSYVDEVVKFIEKNTSGVSVGQPTEEFVDPFTGASRYRSSGGQLQAATSSFADPFTGGSRYQPPSSQSTPSGLINPATKPPSSDVTAATSLPVLRSISFKQANIASMKAKLQALNAELASDLGLALKETETKLLEETFTALNTIEPLPAAKIGTAHVTAVRDVLTRWPPEKRFPVLDLARLMVVQFPSAYASEMEASYFSQSILQASEWLSPWNPPLGKARETNTLLALRAWANAVQDHSKASDLSWINQVLSEIQRAPISMLNKNQRIALATLLFNVSTVAVRDPLEPTLEKTHLELVTVSLMEESEDSEAYYRAVVALGNSLVAITSQGRSLNPDVAATYKAVLTSPAKFSESRIELMVKEILKSL